MNIFDIERKDGIGDIILANNSLAYTLEDINDTTNSKTFDKDVEKWLTKASADDRDVYKTYSVLVTTNWNKNDDVFDPLEVIQAKDTPIYKPTNLDHDETKIVGSMIDSWVVDDDYNIIDDVSNLDYFHILVASVVYRQWQDPKLKARAEELIKQIESGEMKVSMECIFTGFDYALKAEGSEEDHKIVARSSETAFLSKHLRAYGGSGSYQGYRVGRILRNITFSAKGHVLRPANIKSDMLISNETFKFTNASKQDFFEETDKMSDVLEKQLAEKDADLVKANEEIKALRKEISDSSSAQHEADLKELEEAKSAVEKSLASEKAIVVEKDTAIASLEKELEETKAELSEAKKEMKEMKDKEKSEARKNDLVKAGMEEEEAVAKVESLKDVSDDAFAVILETVAAYKNKGEDKEDKMKKEEAKAEKKTDNAKAEEILNSVEEKEDKGLSIASEIGDGQDDVLQSAKAELADWFTNL